MELGGNNLTHVEVLTGLVAGDRISLVRPTGAELPGEGEEETKDGGAAPESPAAAGDP